jgi:hypothetical protein
MSQTVPRQLAFITLYLAGLVAAPSRGELLGAALSPASAGRVFMSCGAVRDNLRDQICSARYILLQKKQRSPSLKVSPNKTIHCDTTSSMARLHFAHRVCAELVEQLPIFNPVRNVE